MKKDVNNNNVQQMQFSVIDTERKYSYNYAETTYGANSIVSYGEDNSAPNIYYNCYEQSATLKSIIDGSINYVLGDDVILNDGMDKWKTQINSKGQTMTDLISQIALDFFIYGGFAIQVIYSKLYTVSELYPLNYAKCRTNESGTKIYFSKKNWGKYTAKTEEYDAFNPSNRTNYTQIYYYRGSNTKTVYPRPLWMGALNDVLTEIECSKYSLNTISNGFMAKYMIQLPNTGNLTDEQKDNIETAIKEKFCGADVESNFMLYFSSNNDEMRVSKIESDDTPEKFIAIKDNARSNIYTSMRATPALFGLPNATNGFSTNEYRDSFKLFNRTVIKPVQDMLIRELDKIFGISNSITIKPFTINFED